MAILRLSKPKSRGWFSKGDYKIYKLKAFQGLNDYENIIVNKMFNPEDSEILLSGIDKYGMAEAVQTMDKKLYEDLQQKGFYKKSSFKMRFMQITSVGYKAWSEVKGFENFLTLTEKERMAFHFAPDKHPEKFSEFLPYAIALGVEKEWAKQFAGLEVMKDQNWYASSYMSSFIATDFVNHLNSGFASYTKSNYVSSSSTGSGGSFSGGGFGGGGGGSW